MLRLSNRTSSKREVDLMRLDVEESTPGIIIPPINSSLLLTTDKVVAVPISIIITG